MIGWSFMKNCYEFVLTYGPVPFIIHVSSMIGWSFMKKKAVDPDRIHPVLSMFLDRREELFFFSSSFFFFFFLGFDSYTTPTQQPLT
jgi:hypothetical protein